MQKSPHSIQAMFAIRLLLITLLTSSWSILQAQNIDFNNCGVTNPITKTVGTDPTIHIEAVNTPGLATATITILEITFDDGSGIIDAVCGGVSPGACTTSQVVNGVTVDATAGDEVNIGGTLTETGVISVVLIAEADGVFCQVTYTITVERRPLDVMLVIDNSISMNCCTGTNDVTCVTCATPANSRMANLKSAVSAFLNMGGAGGYFNASDRFGAVIFSGTIDASHAPYDADPLALNTFIQGILTSSGTCLGGGLIEAVNQMTTQSQPGRDKVLILFTDGEQNFNPMLANTGSPIHYEAGDLPVNPYNPAAPVPPYGSCMPFPGSTPTFDNAFRDTSPGIRISTIGFDLPAGIANTLLSNISDSENGAGGFTYLGSIPADYTDFFTDHLVAILSGSSPQVVKRISGVTTSGVNTTQFIANDTLSKVSFVMMGSDGDGGSLRFRVIKNGVDVTQYGRIVDQSSYRIWHINFPIKKATGAAVNLRPGGTWTLQTSDTRAGVKYRATCIVDDHRLDFKSNFGDPSKHSPGKPIPLSVSLSYKGAPLDSARVVVAIERNTNDGGTLLATLATPDKIRSFQSGNFPEPAFSNLGQVKHVMLLQTDASYQQGLTHVVDTVVLNNNHDGTYTNEYIAKVTGPHKFTFLVNGKDVEVGPYQREKIQSGVVRLKRFDLSSKNFVFEKVLDGDVFSGYRLTFTLKDSSGLYLGPAFESAIALESKEGKFGRIADNLDGSYSAILTDVSEGADPVLDIKIYGVPVFTGNISTLTDGHSCPSWIPGFLAKLFHAIGLNCIVGLILLMLIVLIIWFIRRKK
jgi:hypothetical protein